MLVGLWSFFSDLHRSLDLRQPGCHQEQAGDDKSRDTAKRQEQPPSPTGGWEQKWPPMTQAKGDMGILTARLFTIWFLQESLYLNFPSCANRKELLYAAMLAGCTSKLLGQKGPQGDQLTWSHSLANHCKAHGVPQVPFSISESHTRFNHCWLRDEGVGCFFIFWLGKTEFGNSSFAYFCTSPLLGGDRILLFERNSVSLILL